LPTVYVSGDNASVDVVRSIVSDHGPFDAVVLFIGGAQVPEAYGPVDLTLSARTAVEAARVLVETSASDAAHAASVRG